MKKKEADLKVFNAIAAHQRLDIIKAVYNKGPLSYVEIMNQLRLDPSRDAGKFAYHLRTLRQAGLLELNKTAKKYRVTSIGALVIDFSQNIEKHTLRENKRLLVRTSRLAMEEFDRNKIVNTLREEAGVPIELARKIAVETEERLLKLDTLYLTAPLIREFVNAALIEKGLQEYRHKLTRLGLPVHDVSQLIKKFNNFGRDSERVDRVMGKNVMTEYVLLDVLPREVADAHLSGLIHLSNIDMWVLKPDSFQHDIRFFLSNGYRPSTKSMMITLDPPKNLEDALAMVSTLLCSSGMEITDEEGVKHFNVFLAPFLKNIPPEDLKTVIRRFFIAMNQSLVYRSSDVSLGIDLSIPPSLKNVEVEKVGGKKAGTYNDYLEESLKIFEAILDIMIEDSNHNPLYRPHLIINVTPSNLKEKDLAALLLKTHMVASKYGNLYFVNLAPEWQKDPVYFATGVRLASDWTGDSELDTLRTGGLNTVVINLPRIAYSIKSDENKLFTDLDTTLEIVVDSLKNRHRVLEERIDRNLLSFLSQKINGESYIRMKNITLLVSFVGLNEAVKSITGKQIHEDADAMNLALKIVERLNLRTKKASRESNLRIAISQSVNFEGALRLAKLDVENFGWGKVLTQGTRYYPYYTDMITIPLESDISLTERLRLEGCFHPLLTGGHLSLIEIEETTPDTLLKLTQDISKTNNIGAYTFTRSLGYCLKCQKVFHFFAKKCPECKAVNSFINYSRLSSKYMPIEMWPQAKRENIDKRISYRL